MPTNDCLMTVLEYDVIHGTVRRLSKGMMIHIFSNLFGVDGIIICLLVIFFFLLLVHINVGKFDCPGILMTRKQRRGREDFISCFYFFMQKAIHVITNIH